MINFYNLGPGTLSEEEITFSFFPPPELGSVLNP